MRHFEFCLSFLRKQSKEISNFCCATLVCLLPGVFRQKDTMTVALQSFDVHYRTDRKIVKVVVVELKVRPQKPPETGEAKKINGSLIVSPFHFGLTSSLPPQSKPDKFDESLLHVSPKKKTFLLPFCSSSLPLSFLPTPPPLKFYPVSTRNGFVLKGKTVRVLVTFLTLREFLYSINMLNLNVY